MRRLAATLAVLAATAAPAALGRADDGPAPIGAERFAELHAQLQPKDVEPWQTIPWVTDLTKARAMAIERGQPLFMWSMNGHPLGCT